METVHIYRLQPTKKLFAVLRDAQMEAAKVWNLCIRSLSMSMCRFLVPSRIYVLVSPGVVVGQTRPWHPQTMLVV